MAFTMNFTIPSAIHLHATALRSRPLYTFFRKKHGKGVDKTNLECYRKSIDVSTPLKRVLTKPEGKELEEWNWMREKGKY